jgi:hydroxypyruvate reductase
VDPEPLTTRALADRGDEHALVVAIGKAAPAMTRGAAAALDVIGGVCVSDHEEEIPAQVDFVVGNHPLPGPASRAAAEAILEIVRNTPRSTPILALISGGGSTLCEMPRPGVSMEFLARVNQRLLGSGVGIEEINLVRSHLSAVKCGGISRAAGRPIDTYVLSDVGSSYPEVVASGPTIPRAPDPETALAILARAGLEPDPGAVAAMRTVFPLLARPLVTLIGDGRDAAVAVAAAAPPPSNVEPYWLDGDVEDCLGRFLTEAGPGVWVAAGETYLDVRDGGRGGRNTHAALLAAHSLSGTDGVFTAFATDGVDGPSGSAGAIVDGTTTARGGDPGPSLAAFDSATYLATTSDLLKCGPTGTNVSDIWILWQRETRPDVE